MTRDQHNPEQTRFEFVDTSSSVNPAMITLGRESRGLSQTELSKRLHVTQGWLSKVENGLLNVSEKALAKISQALGYPTSFFLQQEKVFGMGTSEMFHRKRMSVPDRVLDAIYARINIQRMHLARLLKSVDIGQWDFPRMNPEEFGSPTEVAQALRAHWLVPRGPIAHVVKLIEDAGGIVIPVDFEGAKVDAISHWVPGLPPLFFVNTNSPGDRLRFTLAHEIGHIVMHTRTPTGDMEEQADEFASEFLMPAVDIRPYLSDLTLPKLAALKPVWKVSMSALTVRADRLGLLTDRKKRALWSQLGPMRTREPAELDIPLEVPFLLSDIIRAYRTDMTYSLGELAAILHLNEEETRHLYAPGEQSRLRVVQRSPQA